LEEQLALQREEHEEFLRERAKRPVLWGKLALTGEMEHAQQPVAILRATVGNDGDKLADALLVELLVPSNVSISTCESDGTNAQGVGTAPYPDVELTAGTGEVMEAHANNRRLNIPPGEEEMFHVLLWLPYTGMWEVEMRLHHPNAEPVTEKLAIDASPGRPGLVGRALS
jgi:hypothetical protein